MFVLLLQAASTPGSTVALEPEAASLVRKIQSARIRARVPAASRPVQPPVVVTDIEMNAWLRSSPENRPKGVSEMTVRFEPDRLVGRGLVDLSVFKPKVEISPWNPLYWINGIVPVDVTGRVTSDNGQLSVIWEDVRVASISVSANMLRDLVVSGTRGTRRYPDGFDITAPYAMPYAVRRIRLDAARAIVEF